MGDTNLLNSEIGEMPQGQQTVADQQGFTPKRSAPPTANKGREAQGGKTPSLPALILAIIMIILTLLPIARTRAEINGTEFNVNLSGVDCIKIALYTMIQTPESKLKLTNEYINLKRLGYPEAVRITNSSLAKDLILVELRGGYSTLDLSSLVMAFAIIGLWIICALIIFSSLKCIFFEMKDEEKRKGDVTAEKEKLSSLSLATALLMPLFGFILAQGASIGVGKLDFLAVKGGLNVGYFLIVVAAVVLALAFYGKRLAAALGNKSYVKKHKKDVFALILCAVMLIALFLPVLSCELKDVSSRKSAKISFDSTDIFEMSYDDTSYYSASSTGSTTTEAEINNFLSTRRVNGRDKTLLYGIIMGVGFHRDRFTTTVFYLSSLVVFGLFALISHRVIRSLTGEKGVNEIKKPAIGAAILVVLQIILAIVLISYGNNSFWQGNLRASFGMGVGPILSAIAVAGLILITRQAAVSDEVRIVDRYYDNPDTSYAPYVVEYDKKKK